MITVLASGPMITVQDLGRTGYRASGVGLAGAMEPLALKLANLLLGNEQGTAGIEIAASSLSIRFERRYRRFHRCRPAGTSGGGEPGGTPWLAAGPRGRSGGVRTGSFRI